MLRTFRWTGLAVGLAFALPALAQKQPDPKKNPKPADPKQTLVLAGSFQGQVVKVDAVKKTVTVKVLQKVPIPNPEAHRYAVDLQRELANAKDISNIKQRIARIQYLQGEIAKNSANLFTVVPKAVDVDFKANDETKIRIPKPPVAFDKEGKQKKYTNEELKALRGPDRRLPGYTGKFENLRPGQVVKVQLVKKKLPAKGKKDERAKEADKAKEAGAVPFASLLQVVAEPPVPGKPTAK